MNKINLGLTNILLVVIMAFSLMAAIVCFCACDGNNEHEHIFGDWQVSVEPTCAQQGLKIRECECGKRETFVLERVGHKEVVDEGIQPTCMQKGQTGGSHCEYCNLVLSQPTEVDKVDHKYENGECTYCRFTEGATEGIEYKLNEDGNSAYVARVPTTIKINAEEIVFSSYYDNLPVTRIEGGLCVRANLKRMTLPSKLKEIGGLAFASCNNLQEVTFGEDLEIIGDYAFLDTSITHLVLPDSLKTIGSYAFDCPIESLRIGKNLTEEIFKNNSFSIGKESIVINNEAISLSQSFKLKSVTVSPESEYFKATDNTLTSKTGDKLYFAFAYEEQDCVIPDQITTIGGYCFYNQKVKSLTITKAIQIEEYGLGYAEFGKVTLGSNITKLGDCWFAYSNVGQLMLEGQITEIGHSAFSYTTGLKDFSIPESVTLINGYAFRGSDIENVEIKPSTKCIGSNIFDGCKYLKKVVINSQLECNDMFKEATIEYCYVGENCTTLPEYCFVMATIDTIEISDACTKVGKCVFVTAIVNTIIIGKGIKVAEGLSFAFKSVTNIYYKGTLEDYNKIEGLANMPNVEKVYFYSQSQPTDSGNYWHYDNYSYPVKW